jgi:hypothetical protein
MIKMEAKICARNLTNKSNPRTPWYKNERRITEANLVPIFGKIFGVKTKQSRLNV